MAKLSTRELPGPTRRFYKGLLNGLAIVALFWGALATAIWWWAQ